VTAGRAHPIWAALEALPAAPAPQPEMGPPPTFSNPEPPTEKGAGTLKLRVPQSGARVFIDGEPWGDARADAPGFLTLPAGDHAVQVEIPGQRSFLTNVRIKNGATTALDVSPKGD